MSTTSTSGGALGGDTTSGGGDSGGFLGDDSVGGFSYGVGVSIGILMLITTITLASYFCTRERSSTTSTRSDGRDRANSNNRDRDRDQGQEECVIEVVGIDEATLKTYPKLLYSQLASNKQESSRKKGYSTVSCCSICLADYKGNDVIRLLPECEHAFHLKCVDPWLRLHPTCPVCRTSPLPTPQSTPLAEVVPLTTRRN